jgi:DNA segregation ATPase FtsK/SpoIIIE, S-DNA-T family
MTTPEPANNPEPERVDWGRYEAELEAQAPAEDQGQVLVDTPEAQRPPRPGLAGLRAAQRRPILPSWLRSQAELAALARWAAGYLAHTSAYHLTRSPAYAGRMAGRAPRGAARLLAGWLRWLLDLEAEPVRQATVRAQDAEAYLKLARQRDRRVRWRATVSCLLLVTLAAAAAMLLVGPPTARWATLMVLVAVLGVVGAPADRPLLERAVVVPRATRLTSDMVVRALGVLGLAGINQALARNPKAIGFVAPITRDGPGWRAEVDLPPASPWGKWRTGATSSPPASAGPLAACGPRGTPRSIPAA